MRTIANPPHEEGSSSSSTNQGPNADMEQLRTIINELDLSPVQLATAIQASASELLSHYETIRILEASVIPREPETTQPYDNEPSDADTVSEEPCEHGNESNASEVEVWHNYRSFHRLIRFTPSAEYQPLANKLKDSIESRYNKASKDDVQMCIQYIRSSSDTHSEALLRDHRRLSDMHPHEEAALHYTCVEQLQTLLPRRVAGTMAKDSRICPDSPFGEVLEMLASATYIRSYGIFVNRTAVLKPCKVTESLKSYLSRCLLHFGAYWNIQRYDPIPAGVMCAIASMIWGGLTESFPSIMRWAAPQFNRAYPYFQSLDDLESFMLSSYVHAIDCQVAENKCRLRHRPKRARRNHD